MNLADRLNLVNDVKRKVEFNKDACSSKKAKTGDLDLIKSDSGSIIDYEAIMNVKLEDALQKKKELKAALNS